MNESKKCNTSTSNEGDYTSKHGKINIGWIHQGKQVKSMDNGGGIRFIEVKNLDEVTVSFIIEKAKQLFFPNGISSKGVQKNMNFSLGNYSKQTINYFNNLEGEECSFVQFLQQHGLYLSRFNLYLMSDLKEYQEIAHVITTKILFPRTSPPTAHTSVHAQVNNETTRSATNSTVNMSLDLNPVRYINIADQDAKPKIEITYVNEKDSSYSEVMTTYSTTFIKDAKEATSWVEPSIKDRENFDPLDYDFSVRRILVNKEIYLDTYITDEHLTEIQRYVFPKSKGRGGFILHEPSEIWGYDSEENLIIGVICSCHGEDCKYTWYRNGEMFKSGHTYCCIIIKQCGNYHVKVEYNEFFDVSKPIQIGLLLGTSG